MAASSPSGKSDLRCDCAYGDDRVFEDEGEAAIGFEPVNRPEQNPPTKATTEA